MILIHSLVLYMLLAVGSTSGSSNWKSLGNNAYRYMTTRLSFHDARESCHEFGGDLAQLKTQEINDFVQDLIGNQAIWFGLSDQEEECTYKWIDGSLLDNSLSSWEGNETVICQQYKDCIQLERATWREHNCSIPLYFMCERSGIYSEQLLNVHLWVSDRPYADDLKAFVIVDQTGNRSYTGIDCFNIGYNLFLGQGYGDSDSVSSNTVSALNSMSEVHELLLDRFSPGKLECRVSSESVDSTTIVSALHLTPYSQSKPSNGKYTVSAYPGTEITLTVTSRGGYEEEDEPAEWYFIKSGGKRVSRLRNGLSYDIRSVREDDQGTYAWCGNFYCLHDIVIIRIIVYDCPEGRWGPSSCLGVCDPCYNGGVCHDLSGSCICPPGFIGNNCLQACGEHRFGPECDIMCGLDQGLNVTCAGSQICRPDPYGCNCLSGYTGLYCDESCQTREYGVDCLQDCRCSGGSACDIYSGECPGDCQDGWSGPSCQVPEVCPDGFYGEYCIKVCHCLDIASCDVETGYCSISNGVCADGYMTEPSRNTFCDVYAGYFDSCSKTCHCSEGATNCNSVTGKCFPGGCLSGWTGPTCQIVSPKLAGSPTLVYKDCDTIAIIWNAWHRDRDIGEGPIGGYDIYLKNETSDWLKTAFVSHDSTTRDILSYVLIGLESDVEYNLSVTPVHIYDVNARPMDVDIGQELVMRTLQCMEPITVSVANIMPWALFGVTLVLFIVFGGALLGIWVYRRMTLTSTSPDNASSPSSPSETQTSSGTKASSPNDYLYENPTFSAKESTPEHTYQDLNKGPKVHGSKVYQTGDQDEYTEIQVNLSSPVYENNRVKVL